LQSNVSGDEWNAFWLQLQPIVSQVQRYNIVVPCVAVTMCIIFVASLILVAAFLFDSWTRKLDALASFSVILLIAVVEIVAFCAWNERVRTLQLKTLRKVCQAQECFGKCGLTVECECEPESALNPSSTCGFFLYLIPAQNQFTRVGAVPGGGDHQDIHHPGGYLRIPLYNDGNFHGAWTPISMPYLESFQAMPKELQAATWDDEMQSPWGNFWSELMAHSREHLSAYRMFRLSLILYVAFYMFHYAMLNESWYTENVRFVASMVVLIPLLYGAFRLQGASNQGRSLVKRHATIFAAHGIFVEYRSVYESSKGYGMSAVHGLYLFPLSVYETRTGEPSSI
jgi:hypothetical protein